MAIKNPKIEKQVMSADISPKGDLKLSHDFEFLHLKPKKVFKDKVRVFIIQIQIAKQFWSRIYIHF